MICVRIINQQIMCSKTHAQSRKSSSTCVILCYMLHSALKDARRFVNTVNSPATHGRTLSFTCYFHFSLSCSSLSTCFFLSLSLFTTLCIRFVLFLSYFVWCVSFFCVHSLYHDALCSFSYMHRVYIEKHFMLIIHSYTHVY